VLDANVTKEGALIEIERIATRVSASIATECPDPKGRAMILIETHGVPTPTPSPDPAPTPQPEPDEPNPGPSA
jgi:hypothetical protein